MKILIAGDLCPQHRVEELFDKNDYSESKSLMSGIFEPLYNRLFFALRQRKLIPSMIGKKRLLEATDIIMCESHIDKLRFYHS